jgi:hypothetical protein
VRNLWLGGVTLSQVLGLPDGTVDEPALLANALALRDDPHEIKEVEGYRQPSRKKVKVEASPQVGTYKGRLVNVLFFGGPSKDLQCRICKNSLRKDFSYSFASSHRSLRPAANRLVLKNFGENSLTESCGKALDIS